MNIKACIFDLDGVIVDTAKYHYLAWKRLAGELGFSFTEAQNEQLKGVSRMTSLDILLKIGGTELRKEEKELLAAKKNQWYLESIREMTPDEILPGTIEFIHEIKSHGIRTAIGSASKNAGFILDRVGLEKTFDAVIDGTKVSRAKPDPEIFLRAAEELNIPPKNCLVFEDAAAGVEAALRGGMACIGIGEKSLLPEANMVVKGLFEMNYNKLNL